MRPTRDQYFLQMAKLVSTRSTCLRRNVGCVLTNSRGHVMATGYNGVPSGFNHCNEAYPHHYFDRDLKRDVIGEYLNACSGAQAPSGTNLEGCQAIHAEENALLQCEHVWEIETCYCTVSPCFSCIKKLLNTSCRRIVFGEEYPHKQCMELWVNSTVKVGDKIHPRQWLNLTSHQLKTGG